MSEAETAWSKLASRVVRVALARKDVSYSELVRALANEGSLESERALVSRISRGTVKLGLLLQLIHITDSTVPPMWSEAIKVGGDWEERARAVIMAELSVQPWVTPTELARRLGQFGTNISERTLTAHLTSGAFALSLFLQCVTALGSDSLNRYVDFEDLSAATGIEPAALARQDAD